MNTSVLFRNIWCAVIPLGLSLTACGGGGSNDQLATSGGTPATPASSPTPAVPSPTLPTPSGCTASTVNDAWLDKRLTCLQPGTKVIDISGSATGPTADYSFVVNQNTYDPGFNNVLGASKKRYFARILCVRNAPSGITDSSNRLSLATDLVVAVRAAGALPAGYSIFMGISGGNQAGFVQEKCETSKHPIIIDFSTRLIEAITPSAMTSVQTYDL